MQTQKEVAALIKQHTQATGELETLKKACNDEVTHSNTQISVPNIVHNCNLTAGCWQAGNSVRYGCNLSGHHSSPFLLKW